ncbi:MAG: LysR family transcriptional regulator [Pseudomonadota bacterium]
MDWEEVKTFTVVVETGTIRKAAEALGVNHSSVSRRLARLEDKLGTALFDRTPDGLTITSAGERLAKAAKGFQQALFNVERDISGQNEELTGALTITTAEPIATHVLCPRLPEFIAQYPGLSLTVVASYDHLDLSRREVDIAIRMDNNPPQTLVGKRLFPYHVTAYGSHAYLAKHDLSASMPTARWLGWGGEDQNGASWTQDTMFPQLPIWGEFNDLSVHMAATRAGLGLGMLPCLGADIDPQLKRASAAQPMPARDIWLLTHPSLRRTARIRAFMAFAETVIRDAKPLITGQLASSD